MKAVNRILFIVCCLWACYSCRGKMPDTEFVLHLPADYSFDISLELADTIVGMDVDDEKKASALLPLEKSGYGRLWVGDRRFPVLAGMRGSHYGQPWNSTCFISRERVRRRTII